MKKTTIGSLCSEPVGSQHVVSFVIGDQWFEKTIIVTKGGFIAIPDSQRKIVDMADCQLHGISLAELEVGR